MLLQDIQTPASNFDDIFGMHRGIEISRKEVVNGVGLNTFERKKLVDDQLQESNYDGALLWMREVILTQGDLELCSSEYRAGWEVIRKFSHMLAEQATQNAWKKVLDGYTLLSQDNQQLLDIYVDDDECQKEILTHLKKNATDLLWPSMSKQLLTSEQAQQVITARGIRTSCEVTTSHLSSLLVATEVYSNPLGEEVLQDIRRGTILEDPKELRRGYKRAWHQSFKTMYDLQAKGASDSYIARRMRLVLTAHLHSLVAQSKL